MVLRKRLRKLDSYIHFEFQTTNKGIQDLRRFRAYEALLSHQTNKDVETYVIYSNGITSPISKLEIGLNTYVVKTVTLVDNDVNEIFENIDMIYNLSYMPLLINS